MSYPYRIFQKQTTQPRRVKEEHFDHRSPRKTSRPILSTSSIEWQRIIEGAYSDEKSVKMKNFVEWY